MYFVPVLSKPTTVTAPGDYLTRNGDRVHVEQVSKHHDFGCTGHYKECGTREGWHKSGRILATSETPNDIVSPA